VQRVAHDLVGLQAAAGGGATARRGLVVLHEREERPVRRHLLHQAQPAVAEARHAVHADDEGERDGGQHAHLAVAVRVLAVGQVVQRLDGDGHARELAAVHGALRAARRQLGRAAELVARQRQVARVDGVLVARRDAARRVGRRLR